MHGPFDSVFIFTTHHPIADGLSSGYAIRDMLRALTGEALEPLPPNPTQGPLVYMSQQAIDDANGSLQPQSDQGPLVTFRAMDNLLPGFEAVSLIAEMTRTLVERHGRSGQGSWCALLRPCACRPRVLR